MVVLKKGPFRKNSVKYYYDKDVNTCIEFVYHGQYGNPNRFETRQYCIDLCIIRTTPAQPTVPVSITTTAKQPDATTQEVTTTSRKTTVATTTSKPKPSTTPLQQTTTTLSDEQICKLPGPRQQMVTMYVFRKEKCFITIFQIHQKRLLLQLREAYM